MYLVPVTQKSTQKVNFSENSTKKNNSEKNTQKSKFTQKYHKTSDSPIENTQRSKFTKVKYYKNPAYGRQRISRLMRIVGPIQFWRGCVIYLIFFLF